MTDVAVSYDQGTFSLFVDLLVNYKNEIPFIFQKIFETIIYDSKSLFINKSITFLIIGMILIAINIVIAKIIDIKEDKKIDL